MNFRISTLLTILAVSISVPAIVGINVFAQQEQEEAVHRACMNYIEGIYDVKPGLIEESVHPELVKIGYWLNPETSKYHQSPMTYEQLVELAGNYNKDGKIAKDAPKKVDVFDVSEKTASAKVYASWGIDYMHLVNDEGKWKIRHILWQSYAKAKKDSE